MREGLEGEVFCLAFMIEDFEVLRQLLATTTSSTSTMMTTPIREVKVCLQLKPQTRRSRSR